MRQTQLGIILLLFMAQAFGQSIQRIDGSTISSDSVDARIRELMQQANVSGMGVTIFNRNKAVFSKTYGWADVEQQRAWNQSSVFYAASLAKMVFAYIALQLVDEKLLDLDKPLVDYLDRPLIDYSFTQKNRGYQDLKNDERYKKLTARMCLTHSTGFPNWRWFEDDGKLKFLFEPGTRYRYSGEGLYLLQFVIKQITGKDYETLSQERVFKPLKMTSTSQVWQQQFEDSIAYGHNTSGKAYKLNRWKEANAAGSMSTTLADFTKFYTALINGKGLSKRSFHAMTNLQVPIKSQRQFGPLSMVDSTGNDNIKLGYGFGVGVLTSPYGKAFFKEGNDDGWQHYSISFTDRGIAIVIVTNNDNGDSIFKELLADAISDVYTPWQWENYIPYNKK